MGALTFKNQNLPNWIWYRPACLQWTWLDWQSGYSYIFWVQIWISFYWKSLDRESWDIPVDFILVQLSCSLGSLCKRAAQ